MSDRLCNYCSYKRMKKKGYRLYRKRGKWGMGGYEVYRLPHGVKFTDEMLDEESELHKKYWIAWMMEIPEYCMC